MISGEMDVVLVPQGTLNRANSLWWSWTWWFFTPTGVGTVVEEGKQTLTLDGKTRLLERSAPTALIFALIVATHLAT